MPVEHPFYSVIPVDDVLIKGGECYAGDDAAGALRTALNDYEEKGMVFTGSVNINGADHLVFRTTPSSGN